MPTLDRYDRLFIVTAFSFQIVLIAFFLLRKSYPELAIRYGWILYALSLLALIVSVILFRAGKPWSFWLGGVLFVVWALFGLTVEYLLGLGNWRNPILWPVLVPYVGLYLSTIMFYWWPLGLLNRRLWYIYAVLFLLSTWLNLTSH